MINAIARRFQRLTFRIGQRRATLRAADQYLAGARPFLYGIAKCLLFPTFLGRAVLARFAQGDNAANQSDSLYRLCVISRSWQPTLPRPLCEAALVSEVSAKPICAANRVASSPTMRLCWVSSMTLAGH